MTDTDTDTGTPAQTEHDVRIEDEPDADARTAPAPFPDAPRRTKGYEKRAVDAFLDAARRSFEDDGLVLTAAEVRQAAFPLVRHGYAIAPVDAALGRIEDAFAARERTSALSVRGSEEWVGDTRVLAQEVLDRLSRRRGHRFARAGLLRYGYRIDEVDIVGDRIAAYLADGAPVTVEQVRAVAFRMQRRGYRETQVDALLDAVVEIMLAVR